MEKTNSDWEEKIKTLITATRAKAKSINRFVDLEDLAVDIGDEIKNMLLQGIADDKGDGADLPKQEGMGKLKNKGIKKKE
jgi:hypothetical protein